MSSTAHSTLSPICLGQCLKGTGKFRFDEKENQIYEEIYEKKENADCKENCQAFKCYHYEICRQKEPLYILNQNQGICSECTKYFQGIKLDFKNDYKCSICLETRKCVSQPKCLHYLCVSCFRASYFTEESVQWPEDPKFPYSKEIENEYDELNLNEKTKDSFMKKYPLLAKYEQSVNEWFAKKDRIMNLLKTFVDPCSICKTNRIIQQMKTHKISFSNGKMFVPK